MHSAVSDDQRVTSLGTLMQALRKCRTASETYEAIRRGLHEAHGDAAVMLLATTGLDPGEYRLLQLRVDETIFHDADPWEPQDTSVHRGGVIAEIIAKPEPRILSGVDWTREAVFARALAGYSSVMAVPIEADVVPIDWMIYLKREPQQFATAELVDAIVQVGIMESLLESRTLAAELARANEQIDRDLRQAGELQRALLPYPLPEVAGLEIAARFQPCSRAGGDLYDFFKLEQEPDETGGERWCVLIAESLAP